MDALTIQFDFNNLKTNRVMGLTLASGAVYRAGGDALCKKQPAERTAYYRVRPSADRSLTLGNDCPPG